MTDAEHDDGTRSITVTHTIDAAREYVFEAWTEVRHLAEWFGPDGFTTTTTAFDFRPGGVWSFVMHAPDGTNYPNWVEWLEIERPERIVWRHGEHANDPNAFLSRVTFDAHARTTVLTLHTIFNTTAQRDEKVERYGAIEGARQTLARLGAHVTKHSPTRAERRTDIEDQP